MAETFRAPYAGSDALSSIDFSKAQITNTIGTGDFDQASLNSSGHQNVFANAEVDTSPDRLPGESSQEMRKRRDTPEYKAARKKRHKARRQDLQKNSPYLKVKGYEKQPTGSYTLDVGLSSPVLLSLSDLKTSGLKIDEIDTIQVHSQEGGRFPFVIDSRFVGKAAETEKNCGCGQNPCVTYGAEEFAAASTARPDLPREKRNVLSSVQANYDPSFSWASCSWGPYFNRFSAEGSNKFYSVWVWERSPGIYTAMGAYGGLGQNPRLFNVGQTRDLQQAVNMAKKKLQSKQKKGYQTYSAEHFNAYSDPISDRQIYKITELGGKVDSTMNRSQASDYIKDLMGVTSGTWRAEYISDLSNSIVQFEDGAGFSSASAPPNDIYFSEEGSAPVQDPMEFGEMANWKPLDGSEGLKRKRAESQVFALTYFLQNDVNMEDITDITEALELYLSLSEDIAEMDASGLQKHPRYEVANRMLSDLSYRLDELQTQLPEIDVDIEMDAEYDAWRSAFTDGAAATQIHRYDRNWRQKVMNPRSRHIKSMWNDAEPTFNKELKSSESYGRSFLNRISPLTWGLGMVGAFFLGKKL